MLTCALLARVECPKASWSYYLALFLQAPMAGSCQSYVGITVSIIFSLRLFPSNLQSRIPRRVRCWTPTWRFIPLLLYFRTAIVCMSRNVEYCLQQYLEVTYIDDNVVDIYHSHGRVTPSHGRVPPTKPHLTSPSTKRLSCDRGNRGSGRPRRKESNRGSIVRVQIKYPSWKKRHKYQCNTIKRNGNTETPSDTFYVRFRRLLWNSRNSS